MDLAGATAYLACPDCGGGCRSAPASLRCTSCERVFDCEDRILDMRARSRPREPDYHRDPEWQLWTSQYDRFQQAFYESAGLVSYINNVYHRSMARWNRGRSGVCVDLGCGIGTHFKYYDNRETLHRSGFIPAEP